MSNTYRTSKFNPTQICSQIAILQAGYYTSHSLIILILELLIGSQTTLKHVLNHDDLQTDTVLGWGLFLTTLINAGVGAILLRFIIKRARLCLDFAATLHFLHLIFSFLYTGHLPRSFFYWFAFLCSLTIMALGGEYLCMQKEMEPIEMAGAKKRGSTVDPSQDVELQRLTAEEMA
ncbi:hypothetical protein HDU85_005169 [Gaertneriomyces sp. JEL0708]|nr:hypothetical protein HDU85_005169 [Gaertneriomyces sp. JEL0708]